MVGKTNVVSRPEYEVVDEETGVEYGEDDDDAVPARADDSVLPTVVEDSQL